MRRGGNLQLNYHYVTHFCFVFSSLFYMHLLYLLLLISLSLWFRLLHRLFQYTSFSHSLVPSPLVSSKITSFKPTSFLPSPNCFAILTSLFPCLRSRSKTLPPLPYCYYYQPIPFVQFNQRNSKASTQLFHNFCTHWE